MEIYQLRTFLTVAHTGHLTRAAERLHLTQPAVSKQIKALEEELGVTLFERTPTGTNLTKSGRLLLAQAEKTLTNAIELVNMAKKMRGETAGTFNLGTIIDPEFLRLGSVLGQLLAYYPRVDVKLTHGISGKIHELISVGELDAGFYLGDLIDPSVRALKLCTLTYVVVAPTTWKERVDKADWNEISRMPWVGTPVHSSQHRLVKEMFMEHGYDLTTVVEADQESSMRSLVTMGVGLCLLRDDIAYEAQTKGQLVVWNKTKRYCPLSFIYQSRKETDVLIDAMKKAIQDVWSNVH
ncbi:LysR family transcriptional regulator [Herbaspirillum sp. GCM10030257]|uniref:LysR family transcriptional regulator n=1 Tax=Herbaspirillum sp. GCM10030257 TaxID=3273393 RepID=UPI00361E98FB